MTRPLTLAHLTAIDLPPPDLIRASSRAGFDGVGLRLIRVTDTTPGYPLMTDPPMMKATKAALAETGLRVSDIEFVKIEPDIDIAALEPFLDAGAELGAGEVITAPYDPDLSRLADRLAALSDLAQARGIGVSLEFFPWTCVPNLATARGVVEAAGPQVAILVDTLHFDRSSSTLDELRALPRDRLRMAHLCDAPFQCSYTTDELLHTARAERLAPGTGQIDLHAIIAALPPDLPLGLEVPLSAMTVQRGPDAVLAHVMKATRDCLDMRL